MTSASGACDPRSRGGVDGLERGAARWARAVCDVVMRAAARRPGRRTASVRTRPTVVPPALPTPSRIVTRLPSVASPMSSQARAMPLSSVGLHFALVTRPIGVACRRGRSRRLRPAGRCPTISIPVRTWRGPRASTASDASRPMKSGLSALTSQPMPASTGFDSASVSWPTIACCFSSRRTRCASTPNGRRPEVAAGVHQRVPEVGAVVGRNVDLVADLAHEPDAQDDRRARRRRRPRRPPR